MKDSKVLFIRRAPTTKMKMSPFKLVPVTKIPTKSSVNTRTESHQGPNKYIGDLAGIDITDQRLAIVTKDSIDLSIFGIPDMHRFVEDITNNI